MLKIPPWNRLPLTIQWLNDEHHREFPVGNAPPMHMAIKCGKLKMLPKPSVAEEVLSKIYFCTICDSIIENVQLELMTCLSSGCQMTGHITCLAEYFLKNDPGEIIPMLGKCPECNTELLWGELLRKSKGCNDIVPDLSRANESIEIDEVSDEDSDDSE